MTAKDTKITTIDTKYFQDYYASLIKYFKDYRVTHSDVVKDDTMMMKMLLDFHNNDVNKSCNKLYTLLDMFKEKLTTCDKIKLEADTIVLLRATIEDTLRSLPQSEMQSIKYLKDRYNSEWTLDDIKEFQAILEQDIVYSNNNETSQNIVKLFVKAVNKNKKFNITEVEAMLSMKSVVDMTIGTWKVYLEDVED